MLPRPPVPYRLPARHRAIVRGGLRTLVFLASALSLLLFALVAYESLRGDRPPEPVESALLEQSRRIVGHQAVYPEPSRPTAIAVLPGLPYAMAFLVGVDFPRLWLLRALALTATLFSAAMILSIVMIETQSWTLAVAAASLALIGQGLFGSLPGTARPESIVLLFVLLGFAALRYTSGILGALLGALFLAGSCLFHQQAIGFVLAACVSLALEDRKRFAVFGVTTGLLVGGAYVALSYFFGPWFNFSAWDEPLRALRFDGVEALHFTAGHLLGKLGICTLVALLSFAMSTRPWYGKRGLWIFLGIAAVLAGLLSTQSTAFEPASLLTSTVALCLVGPLALQGVARHLSATFDTDERGGEAVVLVGLLLQFLVFLSLVPTAGWVSALALG